MQNSILNNITSDAIRSNITSANGGLSRVLERMSSGYKITQAKDNTAGCVIASKMSTRLSGLKSVSDHIQRGISLLNTAEDAYNEISDILGRLRDLSLEASNDTQDNEARGAIEDEADELVKELERIKNSTKSAQLHE